MDFHISVGEWRKFLTRSMTSGSFGIVAKISGLWGLRVAVKKGLALNPKPQALDPEP